LRCPEQAIAVGDKGQVIVSPTVCTLCGVCEKACPIGAIEIFEDIVYVCDLCGGDPMCVKACTEGAIIFAPEQQNHPSLISVAKQTNGMIPSEKRECFLRNQALDIRKIWKERHA